MVTQVPQKLLEKIGWKKEGVSHDPSVYPSMELMPGERARCRQVK